MGLCDVLPQGGCVPSVEPLYLFSPPSPPLRPPLPTTFELRLPSGVTQCIAENARPWFDLA